MSPNMGDPSDDLKSPWMAVVSVRGRQKRLPILPERWSNILLNLPVDIWLSIFHAVTLVRDHSLSKLTASPIMTISAVCQYWRHLTRTTPTLWSRIGIPVTPSLYYTWSPSVLKTHLELSRNTLLDVSIDGQFQTGDWDKFHARCGAGTYLAEPDGVDVWKKRPRDDEMLTYDAETCQYHISCEHWEDLMVTRYRSLEQQLSLFTHRIRSIIIRLQAMESFNKDEYGWWISPFRTELQIGTVASRFPELINMDIACNGEDSHSAAKTSVYWPSSRQAPKLRNLRVRNSDVTTCYMPPEYHHYNYRRGPPVHDALSGHHHLTTLSLCPIALRAGIPNSVATLYFPALLFLCIDDLFSRGESPYEGSRSIFKKFLMKLDTPRLIGIDLRGTLPLRDFLGYLLLCSTEGLTCNLSFVRQLRLMGNLYRRDRLLLEIFQAMPDVNKHLRTNDDKAHLRTVLFWPDLEDLSLHYSKMSHEGIFQHLDLGHGALHRSCLHRLHIDPGILQDHAPRTICQWIEAHGLVYEDWEQDTDAWPWSE